MRESRVENSVKRTALNRGGLAFKWVSRRGVPDRVVLLPVPKRYRDIVNRYVKFVETKSPTGEVTEQQAYVHEMLRSLGFEVHVPHTPEEAEQVVLRGV